MKKTTILILVTLILTSCGVKKYPVTPETNTSYKPELKSINTSEIGITLVTKETAKKYEALEILKEIKVKPNYITKTIGIGETFIKKYETQDFDLFENLNDPTFGIALSKNNEESKIYSTGPTGNGLKFKMSKYDLEYNKTELPFKNDEYFKQEFIYNGKVGNAIKFIYREFINDYARPAFTQDLQYDLKEDKVIGFRGLRLEVIEATNTKIEYRILSYFEN